MSVGQAIELNNIGRGRRRLECRRSCAGGCLLQCIGGRSAILGVARIPRGSGRQPGKDIGPGSAGRRNECPCQRPPGGARTGTRTRRQCRQRPGRNKPGRKHYILRRALDGQSGDFRVLHRRAGSGPAGLEDDIARRSGPGRYRSVQRPIRRPQCCSCQLRRSGRRASGRPGRRRRPRQAANRQRNGASKWYRMDAPKK